MIEKGDRERFVKYRTRYVSWWRSWLHWRGRGWGGLRQEEEDPLVWGSTRGVVKQRFGTGMESRGVEGRREVQLEMEMSHHGIIWIN